MTSRGLSQAEMTEVLLECTHLGGILEKVLRDRVQHDNLLKKTTEP